MMHAKVNAERWMGTECPRARLKRSGLKQLLICALFLCCGSYGSASARVTGPSVLPHAPALLQALGAIDVVPNAKQLRALVPQVEDALYRIACDENLRSYVRKRSVSFLSLFVDSDLARLHMKRLAERADTGELRWVSRYSYVRAWGVQHREAVLRTATTWLQAEEPLLREAVVRALRWVPGAEVLQMVKALASRERSPVVMAAIRAFRRHRGR